MPTVFRYFGFRFFFYANEGTPREPLHIHVDGGDGEAKFRMNPLVQLAYNDGYSARTLRDLAKIIEENRERIERAWNDFFSS